MEQQQVKTRLGVVTIHDACPAFSAKIFEFANLLEDELNIKFNIALIPFFNEKQDLPRFPEFVDKIKSYKNCQIVLHGLYHEKKNGQFDNFQKTTEADAEEQIRTGMEIFHEIGINTNVFIPPAWKLNNSSIKVLRKLGFELAEQQEEYLLLLSQEKQRQQKAQGFKELKLPKVLNWDSTGYPEKNTVNITRDERAFKLQLERRPQIIRIALHPRDPVEALKDQKQIISILKDNAYEIPTYTGLIPKLEELVAPETQLY